MESGGSSRRLRIFVSGVESDPASLERQIAGQGVDADVAAVEAIVGIAAGRSRATGQGFLVSQAVRKAIEGYAVAWATRHYVSEGWSVNDVGATESYDLDCKRGEEHIHVEVKGTTTVGERIILTPNEVAHALPGIPIPDSSSSPRLPSTRAIPIIRWRLEAPPESGLAGVSWRSGSALSATSTAPRSAT